MTDQLYFLQVLDLSAVSATEHIIDLISKACNVRELTLGMTPGEIDRKVNLKKLQVLNFVRNSQLS